MEFQSSPQWKPIAPDDERDGWEPQNWFEEASGSGQSAGAAKSVNHSFHLDDVDGMFGPGAFEPQYVPSTTLNPVSSLIMS